MYTFKDLAEITAKLWAEDGCPWDRNRHLKARENIWEEGRGSRPGSGQSEIWKPVRRTGRCNHFQVMLNSQIAKEKGLLSSR